MNRSMKIVKFSGQDMKIYSLLANAIDIQNTEI
jgi:hypothetical protein